MRKIHSLFLMVIAISMLVSCKKDISSLTKVPAPTLGSIPAYPLSWETIDKMPTPTGVDIPVPWGSGATKGFSSDLWYDYKHSDGWELVYNVFNTTSLPNNPFFVLYNKYRGLLRYYVYLTTSGFTSSSYMTSGLNLAPNSIGSSMLNYIKDDLVDVQTNATAVSKTEPTQVATGTWYASQYEIAYDPKLSDPANPVTYQQLGLNWTLKWTNITQVDLGGTIVGTLKGTITTPGSSVNVGTQLEKGALDAYGLAVFNAAAGPDPAKPENNNLMGLSPIIFKSMRDALTGGFTGVVKNLFSAILGFGSGPTVSTIDATFNANITLTGSQTSSGSIIPDPGLGLAIPGLSNSSQSPGYIPAYNSVMGVFNLTQRPTITSHWERVAGARPAEKWTYAIVPNTVNVIVNPAVSAIAQVTVEKEELVVAYVATDVPYTDGTQEIVGARAFRNGATYTSYTNVSSIQVRGTTGVPHFLQSDNTGTSGDAPVGVRVTVLVHPNDGSGDVRVVKTFLANQVAI